MGVQLPLLTASKIEVVAVRLPETPFTLMLYVPAATVLDAVKVTTLVLVVGFVPKEAVTPAGKPVADRVTLPLNPPAGVTVMVSPSASSSGCGDRHHHRHARWRMQR